MALPSFPPPAEAASAAPPELLRLYTQLHGAYLALEARARQSPLLSSPAVALRSEAAGVAAGGVDKQIRGGVISTLARRVGLEHEGAAVLVGALSGAFLAFLVLFAALASLWLLGGRIPDPLALGHSGPGMLAGDDAFVAGLWARIEGRLEEWAARRLMPLPGAGADP